MNKQFENMQKLAFGKTLINESTKKMTKSAFTTQIKEMILNEINEAKNSITYFYNFTLTKDEITTDPNLIKNWQITSALEECKITFVNKKSKSI